MAAQVAHGNCMDVPSARNAAKATDAKKPK